jgi:hypothetical protein
MFESQIFRVYNNSLRNELCQSIGVYYSEDWPNCQFKIPEIEEHVFWGPSLVKIFWKSSAQVEKITWANQS